MAHSATARFRPRARAAMFLIHFHLPRFRQAMTRRILLPALTALLVATPAAAQHTNHDAHRAETEDERAVAAVVHELFDAMRAGDSATVRRVFHPEARMLTSFRRGGDPVLNIEASPAGFIEAVGTPHDQVWDERIWDLLVRTDGDLAMAWMNYAFFLGPNFSHCGINLFEMVRTADGWRIVGIADTRRREGCEVPAELRD